jgi:hypothetical protein
MTRWLIWSVRCCASGLLMLMVLPLLVMATVPETRIAGLVLAAVFGAAGLLSWPRRPDAWRYDPPTERQLAYAEALGIDVPDGATKGDVSALITQVTGR